ncbi:hypothetical protein [Desulfurococcus amylolyticus]|uniref:hypothetical protein n=1 Tax=Desulfurococcus TaxID=2273 RepID=UPI0023F37ED2|nr:hypothetical protein [Desulfurococcus amylolyticus]
MRALIARISNTQIVIQEAFNYWDIRAILDVLNPLLLKHGYNPVFFFEGTPILGQGGFSVIIKLSKELSSSDKGFVKRMLQSNGLRVIEEDAK